MKEFKKELVDDVLKLRYLKVVNTAQHTAFASYKTLGKIFGLTRSQIFHLCKKRFEEERIK